jgi:hypothetical protein
MPQAPDKPEKNEPAKPLLSLRENSLGLSLDFRAPHYLDPRRLGLILRDELPIIKRFLEDPINWPVLGRKPDNRRNIFLALLLSIDRVGGEEFRVAPYDRVCDVARHRKSYSGPACPLCSVMRLLGRVHGEKLVRITRVIGETDGEGHYLHAEGILLEAGSALEEYREKIKRLPLPPVLNLTKKSQKKLSTDPAATWVRLSNIPAENWSKLKLEIEEDRFKANGIKGFPADLEIPQHEWQMLHDIAKAGGSYAPKMLGAGRAQYQKSFAHLVEVLKKAFPQIPGEPLRHTGTGSYEALLNLKLAKRQLGF